MTQQPLEDAPIDPPTEAEALAALVTDAEQALEVGDAERAEAAASEAAARIDAAGALEPDDAAASGALALHRRLAQVFGALGDHALATGAPPSALARYGAMLTLYETLAEADAAPPARRRDLAFGLYRLGTAELALGRKDPALGRFERGVALVTELSNEEPEHEGLRRDLSASRSMLGDALTECGRREDALREYRAALSLAEAADGGAEAEGGNLAAHAYTATLHRRIGAHQIALKRAGEAAFSFKSQAARLEALRRAGAGDLALTQDLAQAYGLLAELEPANARPWLRAALDVLGENGPPAFRAALEKRLKALR